MNCQQNRRRSLSLWLQTIRLPLTLTEAVVRRNDDDRPWPPALAFETFEGTVKEAVGRLTRDDTLVELANLQRAEISERRRAIVLEAESASTAAQARRNADEDQAQLRRQKDEADQRARDAEYQAEVDRRNAKRALQKRTARKQTANTAAAATRAKVIHQEETKAVATRVRKDAEVLRAKKKAVAAQGDVLDLDKAVRAKKATRRAN